MSDFLIYAARLQDAGISLLRVVLDAAEDGTRLMRVSPAITSPTHPTVEMMQRYPERTFELCGTDRVLEKLKDDMTNESDLVPLHMHNLLTVGPAPWTDTRVPSEVWHVARAVYGTSTEDDEKRAYRTVQAALWKAGIPSPAVGAPQPEAQPHMVQALKDAIEGECDGLSITDAHAKAILEYVLAAPSAQPEAQPVPAAWIRWEWNRSGSKSLVFDKPAELSLSEEARGVVYSPLYAAPSAQAEPRNSQAALDVLAERQRQITAEGWTPEHDDEHSFEEMAFAASCYACADEGEAPPSVWPWDWKWWKPKSRRRNLVKAGALILAEIERLDRKAQAKHTPHCASRGGIGAECDCEAQAEQATSSNGEDYKQAHGAKNCMQCAAAYMLGLPLSSVPDFEKAGPDAWESFYAFFAKHGFTAEMFPPRVEIEGDYLASGTTERGTNHMVVMRNGTLLHDPHPSNAGLTSLQAVWVIARKAQAEQKGTA